MEAAAKTRLAARYRRNEADLRRTLSMRPPIHRRVAALGAAGGRFGPPLRKFAAVPSRFEHCVGWRGNTTGDMFDLAIALKTAQVLGEDHVLRRVLLSLSPA